MTGRIRTLKPEWLEDELLASLSDEARVLSVALILMSDDYGRGRGSLGALAAGAWRYEMESDGGERAPEVLAKASRAFRELVEIGYVGTYDVGRQRYFELRNWSKHQRVDRPSKPRIPAPDSPISYGNLTLASPSRAPRQLLAPDLDRDQGSPTGSETRAPDPPTAHRPAAASQHLERFERSLSPDGADHAEVVEVVSRTRVDAGGGKFKPSSWRDRDAVHQLAQWASDPEIGLGGLETALRAFWASKGARAALEWLVESDPGRYLARAPPTRRRGPIEPATAEDCKEEGSNDF